MKTLILLFLILIPGCKLLEKQPVKVTQTLNTSVVQTINTKESIKLILDRIQIDSASIKMFFDCDSNNKVILKTFNIRSSELVYFKTAFNNGILDISALTDSIKFYRTEIIRFKDSISSFKRDSTTLKTDPVNYLTTYQKFAVKWFSWSICGLFVFIILLILWYFFIRKR
jgi:hypothetical protein